MAFSVQLTGASQAALDALSKTISARMKYLNETVSASAHAIMTQTLRSVRAVTKVAKPGRVKAEVKRRDDLQFGYTTKGGYRKMCLRDSAGKRIEGDALGKPRFAAEVRGLQLKSVHVFEFADADRQTYLIAAPSKSAAQKVAKTIAARRVTRYAGLARRALSVLMIKSNTKGAFETVSQRVNRKAYAETRTSETVLKTPTGGVYTLTALDNLRYAKLAVKGEDAAIDLAVRKAVNKSVGLIQHRFKDKSFFSPGDLPPVFPEIKQRKSA